MSDASSPGTAASGPSSVASAAPGSSYHPTPDDPYSLSSATLREPPNSLWSALRQIGPGIVLTGSIVGSGELILTTRFGAQYGFVFLWLILLSCVIKVFVQLELGRYALSEGKPTLVAVHELPGWRWGTHWIAWWWFAMMLTTILQLGGMLGGVAQAIQLAFPNGELWFANLVGGKGTTVGSMIMSNPEFPWAVLTAFAAIALLLVGGYNVVEKITTILVVSVTAITVFCMLALPATGYPISGAEIVDGLKFQLPPAGMAMAFAVFGITGVGASELFYYPYWCLEKGYARFVGPKQLDDEEWARRARGWMRVMHLDAWVSMLVFTFATVAFYALGATVLHRQGLIPEKSQTIAVLSEMYVPTFGPWTRMAFLLGAFAVLFKTLYVATAGNSRLTADFFNLIKLLPLDTAADRRRVIRQLCMVYPIICLLLYTLLRNPPGMVEIGGFMQGTMLPLITGAALYLRYYRTDPRIAPRGIFDVALWFTFIVITAGALWTVQDTVRKFVATPKTASTATTPASATPAATVPAATGSTGAASGSPASGSSAASSPAAATTPDAASEKPK